MSFIHIYIYSINESSSLTSLVSVLRICLLVTYLSTQLAGSLL